MILPLLLAIGMFSGFWGVLQVIGDSYGPAYLYRVTNNGQAVGLFANRNHQAVFLAMLFPMMAVYASTGVVSEAQRKFRTMATLAAASMLVPLLLVTGSRAGLLAALIGVISGAALYRKPKIDSQRKRGQRKFNWKYPIVGLLALLLVALTIVMSRAQSLVRLLNRDPAEDIRVQSFDIILKQAWDHFPVGTGFGSFVEMFKIIEPKNLLGPSYFNHAHNDWLELFLTGGAPAMLIAAIVVIAALRVGFLAFRAPASNGRGLIYGRLAFLLLFIFALASFVDYPLRVPSMACVFVIVSVWLHDTFREKPKKTSELR